MDVNWAPSTKKPERHCQCCHTKMAEEEGGEGEYEKGEESNYMISYNMPLQCNGTVHH